MARRMYDLDNGVEKIKVDEVQADKVAIVGSLEVGNALTLSSGTNSPFNDLIESNGPSLTIQSNKAGFIASMTFSGTRIAVNKMFQFGSYTTLTRPTADNSKNGVVIYDSDMGKLILCNGTAWVNLDGTALS